MSDLNDPRVLFAAERTLLAWNRTALALLAFGFLVERFGLFLELFGREEAKIFQRHISLVIGVVFMLLATFAAVYSVVQHRRVLNSLRPAEIPAGYNVKTVMVLNGIVAFLGIVLSLYVLRGFV
jgi:putative membrane protein